MIFLEWFLPFLIGASLGVIGGGGTVLAVPVFIYVFSQDPKSAIGMSLGVVSFVSLLGSYSHWKQGNVKFENAAFFTPFAMLGAFMGAKLASLPWLTSDIQLALFNSTVLVSALLMILRPSPKEVEIPFATPANNETPSVVGLVLDPKTITQLALQGFLIGLLTGVVGVGGGFLIVPSLVLVAKIPIRSAIGTSLVVIFFNSLSGFLGYLGKVEMNYLLMLTFLLLASAGVLVGVRYGQNVPKKWLTKGFGVFLLLIGTWIFAKEILLR